MREARWHITCLQIRDLQKKPTQITWQNSARYEAERQELFNSISGGTLLKKIDKYNRHELTNALLFGEMIHNSDRYEHNVQLKILSSKIFVELNALSTIKSLSEMNPIFLTFLHLHRTFFVI